MRCGEAVCVCAMGAVRGGGDVLAMAVLVVVAVLSGPTTHALFLDRQSPVRQVGMQGKNHIRNAKIYVGRTRVAGRG